MLPQRVPNAFREEVTAERLCSIAFRWGIRQDLLARIARAAAALPFDIWIFSGARSRSHQEAISDTPFDRSTHADTDVVGCPRLASGADVQPVSLAVRIDAASVAQFGAAMVHNGLRWGGGAPVDDTGIPEGSERWHVDLGPRPTR